jgi:hypothetical protein
MYVHACVHVRICKHACVSFCVNAYACVCVCVFRCICAFVSIHVCVCVYAIHKSHTCINTYLQKYIHTYMQHTYIHTKDSHYHDSKTRIPHITNKSPNNSHKSQNNEDTHKRTYEHAHVKHIFPKHFDHSKQAPQSDHQRWFLQLGRIRRAPPPRRLP